MQLWQSLLSFTFVGLFFSGVFIPGSQACISRSESSRRTARSRPVKRMTLEEKVDQLAGGESVDISLENSNISVPDALEQNFLYWKVCMVSDKTL